MSNVYDKSLDYKKSWRTIQVPNTIITNNSIPNGYVVCDGDTPSLKSDTYEKFLDSLDEVKDKKLLMTHTTTDINIQESTLMVTLQMKSFKKNNMKVDFGIYI